MNAVGTARASTWQRVVQLQQQGTSRKFFPFNLASVVVVGRDENRGPLRLVCTLSEYYPWREHRAHTCLRCTARLLERLPAALRVLRHEMAPELPPLIDEIFTQAGPFAGQIGVGAIAGAWRALTPEFSCALTRVLAVLQDTPQAQRCAA